MTGRNAIRNATLAIALTLGMVQMATWTIKHLCNLHETGSPPIKTDIPLLNQSQQDDCAHLTSAMAKTILDPANNILEFRKQLAAFGNAQCPLSDFISFLDEMQTRRLLVFVVKSGPKNFNAPDHLREKWISVAPKRQGRTFSCACDWMSPICKADLGFQINQTGGVARIVYLGCQNIAF